mgnify:CR=1 FL=1
MTLQYVPIIDLGPYFGGTAEGKAAVAKAVNQACRDIGFLVITQHQIPAELVERVSQLTSQFFDLPMEDKRKANRLQRRGGGKSFLFHGRGRAG